MPIMDFTVETPEMCDVKCESSNAQKGHDYCFIRSKVNIIWSRKIHFYSENTELYCFREN